MKRTDQERIERELKRKEKRLRNDARREASGGGERSGPSDYVKDLHELFQHDQTHIYNVHDDEVMELLLEMKEGLPEDKWESVMRSAIRKTKVAEKDFAFEELKSILDEC